MHPSLKLLIIGCAAASLTAFAQETAQSFDTPSYIEFSSTHFDVQEGETNAFITIVRSGDYRKTATVEYTTQDGTATCNVNFQATGGTLVFAAGESFKTINVPILRDQPVESAKKFQIQLSDPAPDTVVTTAAAEVEIKPDPPTLVIKPGVGVLEVSWPDVGLAYALEVKTEGSDWTAVSNKTTLSGGTVAVKVATDLPMAWFRLKLDSNAL